MRIKWEGKTKRRWHIWKDFDLLINLCEQVDGPIVNYQWLLDEIETVGELEKSSFFIDSYNNRDKKRGNPHHSSLAFFLGITDEAPTQPPVGMKMSQGRLSAPDIDLDFEDRYRDKVIEYTRQRHGAEKTAQIITFSEIGAKKAVRDVCRVLDHPYELGDKISKAMPAPVFGVAPDLNRCMESDEFRSMYETDEQVREIIDYARKLEGLWRDTSVHAAGFLIADAPITDYVPVMQKGPGEPIVTQWGMDWSEKCGLLKIDFLGLRNLSIVSRCIENIKETKGIDIGDPYKLLDEPDEDVFKLLQKGYNNAIFQMESDGFRELMVALQPTDLNDLSAMLALYRPGPMGSNVHVEYAERKNGRKPVRYLHESLKPILSDTYGLLLYQEQLIAIAKQIAGLDTFEADALRQVVGKKKIEEMPKQKAKFVDGCIKVGGMPRNIAEALFKEIEHHASYSFNKSHSMSYGIISYITAYLKSKHPIEYMAAALSASFNDADRTRLYLNECRNMGIEVKRPSVNYSGHDFVIKDNSIVYGLDSINGFGSSSVDAITDHREENPYTNVFDFLRRASDNVLNKKSMTHLLKSGSLDELLCLESFSSEMKRNERVAMLFSESEQLGVFLMEHPFLDLKDLILEKIDTSIGEIDPEGPKQWVKVAGIITNVVKKTTKSGKRMFVLEIEDETDAVEVVVFPKPAESLPEEKPFVKGELIVVEGKVRIEGHDETTTVSIIYTASEKIDFASVNTEKPIILRSENPIDIHRLKALNDIINNSSGSSTVLVETKTGSGKMITFKFEKTVSNTVETTLKNLIEV